ncbi:MAG: ABC transporter ATP-binding protein [Elusimicrobia bacterium]|nr:ABC transporter ATP-binding protein [Elusimicrobiota bacterium]
MSEPIVVFSDVVKIYRRSHLGKIYETAALRDFSMEIFRGEIIGILGLNGAGKTTVMKLLTGLLYPTSGKISVFGKSPLDMDAKSGIGFLPELPYFYQYMTPVDALRYYAELSGLPATEIKKKIDGVLKKTGISSRSDSKISEFSKGMMQRLGIAQSVIHDPELLILDEPVSGLDPLAIHDIRELMSELNKEGKTIFLSSHSISELEKVSDRVIVLNRGRMVKAVKSEEWQKASGGLEEIFVSIVKTQ